MTQCLKISQTVKRSGLCSKMQILQHYQNIRKLKMILTRVSRCCYNTIIEESTLTNFMIICSLLDWFKCKCMQEIAYFMVCLPLCKSNLSPCSSRHDTQRCGSRRSEGLVRGLPIYHPWNCVQWILGLWRQNLLKEGKISVLHLEQHLE